MNANKVTMTLAVETLSMDSVPSLLQEVSEQIRNEVESGKLQMNDGDSISWITVRTPVTF